MHKLSNLAEDLHGRNAYAHYRAMHPEARCGSLISGGNERAVRIRLLWQGQGVWRTADGRPLMIARMQLRLSIVSSTPILLLVLIWLGLEIYGTSCYSMNP